MCIEPCAAKCDYTVCTTTTTPSPHCPEPNGKFPNKDDCGTYWVCVDGVPTLHQCHGDFHWSEDLKQCIEPCVAKCIEDITCVMTTTPSPHCPESDGKFPNKEDCRTYWECEDGQPSLQHCPGDFHWSEDLRQCIEPCAAKCDKNVTCEPKCPFPTGVFPNKEDCTKYYICINSKPIPSRCRRGEHWSVKYKKCMHPCLAKCDPNYNCEKPTPTTTEGPTYPTPPTGPPGTCKGKEFYPHKNCSKFYHCDHGIAYEKDCPDDLHWSVERNRCEWQCIAKCDKNLVCTTTTEGPTYPTPPTGPPGTCEGKEFYPHKNCRKFYHCAHGVAYEKDCPGNLHWSVEMNRCEWPCIAKCDKDLVCTTTTQRPTYPTPPTGPPGTCEGKEFYPHKNCRKFYHCAHGVAYEKDCPANLHWSVEMNRCEWPCIAKCDKNLVCPTTTQRPTYPTPPTGPPGTCEGKEFYPHKNCRKFYHCAHGVAYEKDCPANLHWSVEMNRCEWPCIAKCDKDLVCKTTTQRPTYPTPPTGPPGTCNGKEFYPHKNCRKFYHCAHGVAYEKDCPANLHWNVQINRCDWPCDAKCDKNLVCTTTPTTTTTTTTTTRGPTTPPPVTGPPGTCKGKEFYPHKNCSKFYHCDHGIAYEKDCPDGLHWSVKRNRCEWPCIAKCDKSLDCRPSTTVKPPRPTPTSRPPVTGPPGTCDGKEFYPHKNCRKFYHCAHGVAYEKDCPANLHWSVQMNRCEWPCIAKCKTDIVCPPDDVITKPITTTPMPGPKCKHGSLEPDPVDCRRFYHCAHGIAYHKWCPAGLHWNNAAKVCDWPASAGCDGSGGGGGNGTGGGSDGDCDCDCCLKPDRNDCKGFYLCLDYKLYHKSCGDGLIYNPKIENCDHEDNVDRDDCGAPTTVAGCSEGQKTPYPGDCGRYLECVHGEFIIRKCSSGLHWNNAGQYCDWPASAGCTDDNTGKCKHGSLEPDPKDCRRFYHCSHGVAYHKWCPAGLHWNNADKVCDWPDKAGCNGNSTSGNDTNLGACECDCCLLEDEKDCQKFYLCLDKKLYHKTCGKDLIYNPKIENCDHPDNVDRECGDKEQIKPPTCDFECPHVGLFPHPSNCSKFCHCSHGIPYEKDCPPGLHFNQTIKVCDYPDNAGCENGSGGDDGDDESTGTCNCECCLHTDDKDCTKFYLCLNYQLYHKECPKGLVYNPERETCDYKENVNRPECDDLNPVTPTPTSNIPVENVCQGKELYPHETDCNKFYHCAHGIAYLKKCPANLHFSVERNRCEWQCIAKCDPNVPPCPSVDPDTTTKYPIGDFDCPYPVGLYPDKDDCTKFFHCSHNIPYHKQCKHPLHFNPSLRVCDWPDKAGCKDPTVDPGDPGGNCSCDCCLSPNENDCSAFYLCLHGQLHQKECSKDLLFNPIEKTCEPRQDVLHLCAKPKQKVDNVCQCTSSCLQPKPGDCGRYYQCHGGEAYEQACPEGQLYSRTLGMCDQVEKVECETREPSVFCEKPYGLFGSPRNCGEFVSCVDGVAFVTECPVGMEYDRSIEACTRPKGQCYVDRK